MPKLVETTRTLELIWEDDLGYIYGTVDDGDGLSFTMDPALYDLMGSPETITIKVRIGGNN